MYSPRRGFDDFEAGSLWNMTTRPPLSPVASSSPSWLNSTHEMMSASVTSSSNAPFICEKHHDVSPLPAMSNHVATTTSRIFLHTTTKTTTTAADTTSVRRQRAISRSFFPPSKLLSFSLLDSTFVSFLLAAAPSCLLSERFTLLLLLFQLLPLLPSCDFSLLLLVVFVFALPTNTQTYYSDEERRFLHSHYAKLRAHSAFTATCFSLLLPFPELLTHERERVSRCCNEKS